ncbi:MAG: Ribosome maturation factor RimP [Flavobacteriales bacterium]|nr:Ribosome maturation factor RimP [Flavobacteriales bacterium]
MITTTQILELIDDKLQEKNFFVVYLDVKPGNNIQLEIDGPEGFTIKDCVDFSRQIEHNLDRETEDFELHVSSPGLDKPFRVIEQYQKYKGKEVRVVQNNGDVVEGKLEDVSENDIRLTYTITQKIEGKKKKEKIVKEETIPFTNIKETTIIISFK